MKAAIYASVLVLLWLPITALPQETRTNPKKVWIKLCTGEILTGTLIKVDHDSVDYKIREYIQSVPLKEVEAVSFVQLKPAYSSVIYVGGANAVNSGGAPTPTSATPLPSADAITPPVLLDPLRAKYTEQAIKEGLQGRVVLEAVFPAKGKIREVKVINGLHAGLNESAIVAAKSLQFTPARKNGQEVDYRGRLTYEFNLSPRPEVHKLFPEDGKVFSNQSLQLTLKWPPVPGALKYRLLVQYQPAGNTDMVKQRDTEVEELEYTMGFADYLPGRWKVLAIMADGKEVPLSSWRRFRFEK